MTFKLSALIRRLLVSGNAVLLIVGTIGFVNLSYLSLETVSAADSASNNANTLTEIRDYCKKITIKVLDKSCENERNLKSASNAATYKCTKEPESNNRKYRCILRNAKNFIEQAANSKPKPDNTSEFTAALEKVLLKASGGDRSRLDKPSNDSQQSQKPASESGCADGKCIDPAADPDAKCDGGSCDLIKKYVNPFLNLLSVSFGLIAVISIIIGGIQYTASAGDPQKVTEAKKRITSTLVAVFAYFFLYAFLQFLVPGGVFNR